MTRITPGHFILTAIIKYMIASKVLIRESGIKLLKDIARQNDNTSGLVFHGSHYILTELEPPRPEGHQPLKLTRLPIPPFAHESD